MDGCRQTLGRPSMEKTMKTRDVRWAVASLAVLSIAMSVHGQTSTTKQQSVFYPQQLIDRLHHNVDRYAWAAELRDAVVRQAEPWRRLDDDELWHLMFGSTITRSWMVWSEGYCPSCQQPVPMYNWHADRPDSRALEKTIAANEAKRRERPQGKDQIRMPWLNPTSGKLRLAFVSGELPSVCCLTLC